MPDTAHLPAWGTVSTVRAPLGQIQDFAAWHLEAGAAQVHLYLDEADGAAARALGAHPKITVTQTHGRYWDKRGGRPDTHQVRQCRNAQRASRTAQGLDWMVHIDVDEFLAPSAHTSVAGILAALPASALCARVHPAEALAALPGADPRAPRHFKAFPRDPSVRAAVSERVYGDWGRHVSAGFLSHVAGKMFFRPNTPDLKIRIHNVRIGDAANPGEVVLAGLDLLHMHAADWDHFISAYRFRLARGSYRAELRPQLRAGDRMNMHTLLQTIETDGGEPALRAFFDAVCTARPDLLDRLEAEGLLRRVAMPMQDLRARHFG